MPPRSKGPTSTSAPVVEKSEPEMEHEESAETPSEPASKLGALVPAMIMVGVLALLIVVGLLQR